MYLIVGLGNPESDYKNTRHNMGFNVISEIGKAYKIDLSKTKFKGIYGLGQIENEKVMLLKPQTFMNLSGDSVIEFKNFYKLDDKNIIIICDDTDIIPRTDQNKAKRKQWNTQWAEVYSCKIKHRRIYTN